MSKDLALQIGRMNQKAEIQKQLSYASLRDAQGGFVETWVPYKSTSDTAESGTTTTNITMTAHGMVTGDYIINTSRSNAVREVTVVDVDNVTVTAVTSQTTGDTILKHIASDSTVWSNITAKSTNQRSEFENNKQVLQNDYTALIRYRGDITTDMRLVYDSRNFEISGIDNIMQRDRVEKLSLVEVI